MSLMAKDSGGDFETVEAGTHIARCYRIVDVGTQYSEMFSNSQRKVILTWELPTELMTDGRPFAVSKWYTLSLNEKANLTGDLESWRGKQFTEKERDGFDILKLIGQTCLLNVVHTDKGKAKVSSVVKPPKGTNVPDQMNDTYIFTMDDWNQELFDEMSDSMKEIIMKSEEYEKMTGKDDTPPPVDRSGNANNEPFEDEDIPFS
jgi:hypothetical protein